jgi:uncharacterized protein YidB (DUF937 family)
MVHLYVFVGRLGIWQERAMGLMDILNGMQNGPRGPSDPNAKSSGMSPMTMAILALLAYKAVKHVSGGQPGATPTPAPAPSSGRTVNASLPGGNGGGLSDVLKGGLGGLLAGGAAGTVLSGGLGDLLKQFQQSGHGDAANSWVSNGANKPISPGDLASALGGDRINNLAEQTGLSSDELLKGLSQLLPDVVNHLTPDGRLPTPSELSNRI